MNTNNLPSPITVDAEGYDAEGMWHPRSIFTDEQIAELEAPKREAEAKAAADEAYFKRLAAEREEQERIARQQALEAAARAEAEANRPWRKFLRILVIILALLANVLFFLPLCLLGLFGLSKHPFISYFLFRDYLRSR